MSAGVSAAPADAAESAEWSAEVAAALGVMIAVGQVWAGGGGGAGVVGWPEVGPRVVSLSRWYLA